MDPDTNRIPKKTYPKFYEKAVPVAIGILILIMILMFIYTIAVGIGILSG
jgi:hypothetical protein